MKPVTAVQRDGVELIVAPAAGVHEHAVVGGVVLAGRALAVFVDQTPWPARSWRRSTAR